MLSMRNSKTNPLLKRENTKSGELQSVLRPASPEQPDRSGELPVLLPLSSCPPMQGPDRVPCTRSRRIPGTSSLLPVHPRHLVPTPGTSRLPQHHHQLQEEGP